MNRDSLHATSVDVDGTGILKTGRQLIKERLPSSSSLATSAASGPLQTTMGQTARITLALTGLASWIGGGIASLLGKGGAGAVALIVAGAVCLVISLVGRWPSRISVSGNEFYWDAVEETVQTQIESAESAEPTSSSAAELKILRNRLTRLRQTGVVPDSEAEIFDRGVEAAIQRLLPGAQVVRRQPRSKDTADFLVRYESGELFVETKWRADPNAPFRGRTLPDLLESVHGQGKLLVVANASDDRVTQARALVSQKMGKDGKVVGWRNFRDDLALAHELMALLS
jgi:hypothetical protein